MHFNFIKIRSDVKKKIELLTIKKQQFYLSPLLIFKSFFYLHKLLIFKF
jgi:hypothetical protein